MKLQPPAIMCQFHKVHYINCMKYRRAHFEENESITAHIEAIFTLR